MYPQSPYQYYHPAAGLYQPLNQGQLVPRTLFMHIWFRRARKIDPEPRVECIYTSVASILRRGKLVSMQEELAGPHWGEPSGSGRSLMC